jgi:acyl carrier protein
MINKEELTKTVYKAIDVINEQLPEDRKIEKSANAPLMGDNGSLDSLGLISLVTSIEELIEADFGKSITVLEELESLEDKNPFESVNTLVCHITEILENHQ